MKKKAKFMIILCIFAIPFFGFAMDRSTAARELLDVVQFDKAIEQMICETVETTKRAFPEMEEKTQSDLLGFYNKCVCSDAVKEDVVQMYSELLSVEELRDFIAFYKTTTGQKAIKMMPELAKRSMELVFARIFENRDELQKILQDLN